MYNKNLDKMTQEQLRMQMLAGIITEGQYKVKLDEIKSRIDPNNPPNKIDPNNLPKGVILFNFLPHMAKQPVYRDILSQIDWDMDGNLINKSPDEDKTSSNNKNVSVNDDLLDLVNLLNRVKKETKVDEKGNEFNRLEWELDSSGDFEEKFHIFHDDSTDITITLVAGNGLLLSTNENDIETQANEMELYDPRTGQGYYEVEIDGTPIYYIWDPNA
jgi:hypothetical protein